MAINGTAGRKLEALKLAVRLEGMKERADRELGVDEVIANAEKIDKYMRELPK